MRKSWAVGEDLKTTAELVRRYILVVHRAWKKAQGGEGLDPEDLLAYSVIVVPHVTPYITPLSSLD